MYFTKNQLERMLKRGKIFNHFKGCQYALLYHATDHTNVLFTPEHKIVYANLDPEDNQIFVRDVDEFFSPVDKDKYPDVTQEMRFEVAHEINWEAIDAHC